MSKDQLMTIAKSKGYGNHKRHIFLCTAMGPCTNGQPILELWEFLKARLAELEPELSKATVARSKAGCLRVCKKGPIAIVYPEGTMYYDLTKEKLDKIITEHLIGGIPVEEYSFISSPLQTD